MAETILAEQSATSSASSPDIFDQWAAEGEAGRAEKAAYGTAEERDRLFLEMAWEIDKMARVMPEAVPIEDEQAYFLVRAMCGRMLRLTSVMMDMSQRGSTPDRSFKQSRAIVMLSGSTQG